MENGNGLNRIKKLIEKSGEAAYLAKLKLYQTLTRKIGDGRSLTATEIKTFNQLDQVFNPEISGNGEKQYSDIIDGFNEAVAYLGISKRTLSQHLKKGTFAQNPDGTFKRSELDKYFEKFGRKTKGSKLSSIEEKKEKADLRYRLARARREEMLVRQLKGSLASWKEIENQWSARVQEITAGLEMLGDRLAALLVGKSREEMLKIIKGEIWKLRDSYSREGRYCPKVEKSKGD